MAINFYEKEKVFKLDTKGSSYIFAISDYEYVEHLYYGKKIPDVDVKSISDRQIYTFTAYDNEGERKFAINNVLLEQSSFGSGDMRTPSLVVDFNGEKASNKMRYEWHKIYSGRNKIPGLPCSRNVDCQTLELQLLNDAKTIAITLYYVVYANSDVICRYSKITNQGDAPVYLDKVASVCLDFYKRDFDLITLEGMYLCERSKVQRSPLRKGIQGNGSIVGMSSHHANPFFALVERNADESRGETYGFNLVYSGNFKNEIQVDRACNVRIVSGINDTAFRWQLKGGESFYTPEFIMTFSVEGIGGMSRNMHDHARRAIIEPELVYKPRPVVVNSWEAFRFNVTEDSMVELAKKAKLSGIDTLVLDDGWFRSSDKEGLGDFYTDREKFPNGLKGLSEKLHALGVNFGVWIEPENTAKESKFHTENPTEILSTEQEPATMRNQYVIDFTSDQNVDRIADRINEEFKGVQIEYIKWDCNSYVNEFSSYKTLQGEAVHKQVLGVYKLIEKIKSANPNVLLEMCAGGGGRFDLGMLYYSPQIWASDNTDPFARIYIEYGTSIAYPQSTISCHFSEGVCTSGRVSSYDFRYLVASFGAFGYELDLTKYGEEEFKAFSEYSNEYRAQESLMLEGDLYRLIAPETDEFCAYLDVAKDKSKALFTFLEINTTGHTESMVVRLNGLDENKYYKNLSTGQVLSGSALMNVGVRIGDLFKKQGGKGGSGRRILFVAE
ncbi:MAG: alpha-galactosidase [Clostridia bacterium]|nr:alpha-galactosidase [Clostridia bacterium]